MKLINYLQEEAYNNLNAPKHDYQSIVDKDADKIESILDSQVYSHLVNRKISTLCSCMFAKGLSDNKIYQRVYGFSTDYEMYYDSQGNIIKNDQGMRRERQRGLDEDQGLSSREIAKNCHLDGKKLRDISNKLQQEDYSNYSDQQLQQVLNTSFDILTYFCAYTLFLLSIEDKLESDIKQKLQERIDDQDKFDEYFLDLMQPIKENRDYYEQLGVLKLAKEYKQQGSFSRQIEAEIDQHLDNFSDLGTKNGYGDFWTAEEIKSRIKQLVSKPLEEKIENLQKQPKEKEQKIKQIASELNFSKQLQEKLELTRQYIFLRTFRTDVINQFFASLFTIFNEVGRRNNLKREELVECMPNEITSFNFPSKQELNLRRSKRILLVSEGQYFYTTGEEVVGIWQKFDFIDNVFSNKNKTNKEKITGNPAFKGKTTGKVKVVADNSELSKVKQGDILVTSMTTPDFVPAMERASGFVTNEGGILCHAAVIAREMEKPCIVGTGNATEVLEDGDRVEVDAQEGIINILQS